MTKKVSFSLDLGVFDNLSKTPPSPVEALTGSLNVRSTVFSLGSDVRVSSKKSMSPPDLYLASVIKDGLDNPYVELSWKVLSQDANFGNIVGFNIYRRYSVDPSLASFADAVSYTRIGVDKLARGNKKTGRFSFDRKSIYNIKRGSIPVESLNSNFAEIKKVGDAKLFESQIKDGISYSEAEIERVYSKIKFVKIAHVDYAKFIAEEKNKFLTVKDRNFVYFAHKDKSVGYGEVFDYYVEIVTKTLDDSPFSSVITVAIEDLNTVNPPRSVIAKQLNEKSIQLSVILNVADKIGKVLVYRKADDEVFFEKISELSNINDHINFIDTNVLYSKTYTYRVFSKNIHNVMSQPKQITVFSSVQRITPQSRSNSLKIPIVSAVQDQSSNFIKITISPNDPSISVYEIKRQDITIKERKFIVPSAEGNGYGGQGWPQDKFFVERERVSTNGGEGLSSLKTETLLKEIKFIDETIQIGHIYRYRVRGYDLFGNPSSYAFSTVRALGKKSIRSPFNIRAEILRGFPFRTKILWDDDNLISQNSEEELFAGVSPTEKKSNKILYKVQRRRQSESVYESFPLTANRFIVDEVSSIDAVTFDGTAALDAYSKIPNSSLFGAGIKIQDEIRRAFKLPNFLKENSIYYYRILAISDMGEESNASDEFQISTLADISNPLLFATQVINTKVRPTVARLSWRLDPLRSRPDYWVIERKFDTDYDSFSVIGKEYLTLNFFDRTVERGNSYVYRIKAFDSAGRETGYFETRLTL
jgi:hypothetical protein